MGVYVCVRECVGVCVCEGVFVDMGGCECVRVGVFVGGWADGRECVWVCMCVYECV